MTVSLIGALAVIFPATQRIIGTDFFRAMACFHVHASPPRSPLLFEIRDVVKLTVPEGWPIRLTWAAIALGIVAWGPRRLSVDHALSKVFQA